jgi:hypothetical protein
MQRDANLTEDKYRLFARCVIQEDKQITKEAKVKLSNTYEGIQNTLIRLQFTIK